MDWKQILATVAPWLGAAVGGPLGAAAVEAASAALGLSTKTEDALKQALSGISPEQMLALKQADQNFAVKMQELGFSHTEHLEEFRFKDIDSARQRQVQVKDSVNTVLAYTIVGSFVAMVAGTLLGYAKIESVMAGTLIGYLSAKAEQVLAYYFGSTKGSLEKTRAMVEQAKK